MSEKFENVIFLGKFGEYAVISLYKALGFIKTENMSEKIFVQGGDRTHALKAYNEINPILYQLSYQGVANFECNSTLSTVLHANHAM